MAAMTKKTIVLFAMCVLISAFGFAIDHEQLEKTIRQNAEALNIVVNSLSIEKDASGKDAFQLNARSKDGPDIPKLMIALEKTGSFVRVALVATKDAADGGIDFQLELRLPNEESSLEASAESKPSEQSGKDDVASIRKQISDLTTRIAEYEKAKARYIGCEGELHDLAIKMDKAAGKELQDLQAKEKNIRNEMAELQPKYLALEQARGKVYNLKKRLAELTLGPETTPHALAMKDMQTLAVGVESYAVEHTGYPPASTLMELQQALVPQFMGKMPLNDSWGRPYIYRVDKKLENYWIISYGADGKPEAGLYDSRGLPKTATTVETNDPNQDIILTSGKFIRYPASEADRLEP